MCNTFVVALIATVVAMLVSKIVTTLSTFGNFILQSLNGNGQTCLGETRKHKFLVFCDAFVDYSTHLAELYRQIQCMHEVREMFPCLN